MEGYSVLMSVYAGADPGHFRQAVNSMLEQTVQAEEFVLVCDGPLTGELEAALCDLVGQHPGLFSIVRLPENVGAGAAQNIGLHHCSQALVAKMDADDIAVPDRCEQQLREFAASPELAIVGGWIAEFDRDPGKPFALRKVPEGQEAICHFARRRQPFNNMTVMYRRSAVLAAGGYRRYRRGEDYDLHIRLLHAGYRAKNLQRVLVKVRVNRDALCRRTSWQTVLGALRCRWNAYRMGYSSGWDLVYCTAGQMVMCLSPAGLRHILTRRFLRQAVPETGVQGGKPECVF